MSNTTRNMIEWNGVMLTRKQFKALPRCEGCCAPALKVYVAGGAALCKGCVERGMIGIGGTKNQ